MSNETTFWEIEIQRKAIIIPICTNASVGRIDSSNILLDF